MKSFLLILFFLATVHAEIILPPDPGKENNKTLMGIDSNKNNVRDDVEIFIYKNITKEEKLYRAYLNLAESELMIIRYADDIKKLEYYVRQSYDDHTCISSMVKNMDIETTASILSKIYNTSLRNQVQQKISKKWNKMDTAVRLIREEERHKKCR